MSLKLGNTNIAGTQVLYSTTGNNADGAMTQAATTTELNLKANDTNVVHKTGDESITGQKTFNNAVFTNIGFNKTFNITRGTAPSTIIQGAIAIGKDINGLGLGNFHYYHGTDNSSNVEICCYNPTKSEGYENAAIMVGYIENGRVFTNAPACDINNSILTTISINKSTTGSTKLGSGIVVNWGTLLSGKTITYDKPFSSANSYALVFNNNSSTNGYGRGDIVTSKSSTSATVNNLCENPIRWLAIGY